MANKLRGVDGHCCRPSDPDWSRPRVHRGWVRRAATAASAARVAKSPRPNLGGGVYFKKKQYGPLARPLGCHEGVGGRRKTGVISDPNTRRVRRDSPPFLCGYFGDWDR